jgi:hypothetical protein
MALSIFPNVVNESNDILIGVRSTIGVVTIQQTKKGIGLQKKTIKIG